MKTARPPLLANLRDRAGMLLILAGLIVLCSFTVTGFATPQNVTNLLLQVSTVGMVASTMLFCLASGNFDLSVGTLIPAGGVLCALVLRETGNPVLAFAAALAFGTAVGVFNGVAVAKFRINALITTLSTMMMVRGAAFVFADGKSIGISNETTLGLANAAFPVFYRGDSNVILFQISAPVWVTLALFAPTSMPRVGSSSRSTFTSSESQRPRMTFCWLPPERFLILCSSDGVFTRRESTWKRAFFSSQRSSIMLPKRRWWRRALRLQFSRIDPSGMMPSFFRSSVQ
jgi:hypothetical protein